MIERLDPVPSQRTNSWLRTTLPPVVKVMSANRASAPDGGAQGREMQRVAALGTDLDVVECGAVAEHEIDRGVDLVVDPVGPVMGLEQNEAGAGADHHEGARVDGRRAVRRHRRRRDAGAAPGAPRAPPR